MVLVYLALGVVLFWRVWSSHPATNMQVGGDDWRNVWFMQWTQWALLHGHNPLYTAVANYPVGVNVLINVGAPLLGIVFAPVTLLFGPVAAFNVASTLALPLSATAAYVLIRQFTVWRPAAFAGGLLYGFGPPLMVHGLEGHLNLAFAPLVPLIFLALYELVVRQQGNPRWWGLLLGLLVVGQFFISTEVLLETVVVGAVAVAVIAAAGHRHVRARSPAVVRGLAWAGATAAVLLAWPVWVMARGPAHVTGPVQPVAQAYRANLISPLVPDSRQLIVVHGLRTIADRFASTPGENTSYLGIALLLLLAAGLVWRRRDRVVVVACLVAAGAFILSLGGALKVRGAPGISATGAATGPLPLPEAVLYKIPLLENLIPARFALQAALCLAIVGAVLLQEIHDRLRARQKPGWWAVAVPSAAIVVALVWLLPSSLAPAIGPNGTPAGFTTVARALPSGTVAVVYPFPSGNYPQPLMWQTSANFRFSMPGGSFFVPQGPQGHVAFSALLSYASDSLTAETLTPLQAGQTPPKTPAARSAVLAEWKSWHVGSVIAVPAASANPAASTAYLTWLLGPPTIHAGATIGWSGLTYH